MKTGDDLRRALGDMDEGFEKRARTTLNLLRLNQKEEKVMRKKWTTGLVIALLALAMTCGAVAAGEHWGLLQFLGRYMDYQQPEEAMQAVQTAIPQTGGEMTSAVMSVEEAVYDGEAFYIVVAIRPRDSRTMLLTEDSSPDDSVFNVAQRYALPEWENVAIRDWAKERGMDRFALVSVDMSGVNGLCVSDNWEEDGTLQLMLSGALTGDGAQDIELNGLLIPYGSDEEAWETCKLSFTLQNSGTLWTRSIAAPVVFDSLHATLLNMTLRGTVMGTYITYELEVEGGAETPIYHRFLNAYCNRLFLPGPLSGEARDEVDAQGVRHVVGILSLEPLKETDLREDMLWFSLSTDFRLWEEQPLTLKR